MKNGGREQMLVDALDPPPAFQCRQHRVLVAAEHGVDPPLVGRGLKRLFRLGMTIKAG